MDGWLIRWSALRLPHAANQNWMRRGKKLRLRLKKRDFFQPINGGDGDETGLAMEGGGGGRGVGGVAAVVVLVMVGTPSP